MTKKERIYFVNLLNSQLTQTAEEISQMREFLKENLEQWATFAKNIAMPNDLKTKTKFLNERHDYEIVEIYGIIKGLKNIS
jgi:hypothetical protein